MHLMISTFNFLFKNYPCLLLYCCVILYLASTTVTTLNVVAVNEVSVMVEWTNPQLYAPMIKEYTIHTVSNDHTKMIIVPAGQRNVMITDLVPTFSYNVSIVVNYNVASFMSDPIIYSVILPECEGNTFKGDKPIDL